MIITCDPDAFSNAITFKEYKNYFPKCKEVLNFDLNITLRFKKKLHLVNSFIRCEEMGIESSYN